MIPGPDQVLQCPSCEAVMLQPTNSRFRLALADILEQQGRPEDAAVEREKADAFGR